MKKFGFSKKSGKDEEDPNRSALFGNKKSSAPRSDNPYAQSQPAEDPYMADNNKFMSPYQQARSNVNNAPPGPAPGQYQSNSSLGRHGSQSSTATAPPPYSSGGPASGGYGNDNKYGAQSGYGNDRYGAQSGYGSNKYASSGSYGQQASQRPGGYGGLGGNEDVDANRDALFSGARDRQTQRQPEERADPYGAGSSGAGGNNYGGYGQERQLTAEEQEEEEVADIRRQKKQIVQDSVASTENSNRILNDALGTASSTLARLGAQHERLANTENLLDQGGIATRDASDQTKVLSRVNGSMFGFHAKNPFTASKRTAERERNLLEQNRTDRDTRESTRKSGYNANQQMEDNFRQVDRSRQQFAPSQPSAAEKSRYAFENDSEDEENEEKISRNLDNLSMGVSQLNTYSKLMGQEIESQNQLIDRLGTKSDALSDATVLNTARLNKIR